MKTEIIAVFAFMRCDAVLCRAAFVVGSGGLESLFAGNLAVVCIVGGSWKLDGHTIFS